MKKIVLMMSIFALFSCGSSDSKKGGGKLDLSAACDAQAVDEFFAALAGSIDLPAIDARLEATPPKPATEDTTFTAGEKYKVTFSSDDNSVTIATDGDDVVFEFDEADEDNNKFGNHGHEVQVRMDRDNAIILVNVPCGEEEGEPLFVTYSDPAGWEPPYNGAFDWRLDAGAN